MKLKYTLEFTRIAVVQAPKGLVKVGDITFFETKPNGDLSLEVVLSPNIPKEIFEAINKNPELLGIQSIPKPVTDLLEIP